MRFSQEMPFYYFYTMVQNSQKWPKTQIKGVPALKTYIAQFTESRMIMKPRTCKVIVETAFFFFFFFFNIAGKHERLYCWLSHLHTIAQGRHETAGICFLSWFCYDISVKEKKKERRKQLAQLIFRSSPPVSCKKPSLGSNGLSARPNKPIKQQHNTTSLLSFHSLYITFSFKKKIRRKWRDVLLNGGCWRSFCSHWSSAV